MGSHHHITATSSSGGGASTHSTTTASHVAVNPPASSSSFRSSEEQGNERERQQQQLLQSGVDYDVLPRGTIYLAHCRVEANDRLTRPHENFYVFTIWPPSPNTSTTNNNDDNDDDTSTSAGPCFLATTTAQSRKEWIDKLTRAIASIAADASSSSSSEEQQSSSSDHGEVDNGTNSVVSSSTGPRLQTPLQHQQQVRWNNLVPPSQVLNGVPRRLSKCIEENLARYVPLTTTTSDDHSKSWKVLLKKKDCNLTAHERHYNHCSMLRTVATMPFSPKQVFRLLVDHGRRQDFEANVRSVERLKQYNSHTFLDYYAYQAVWPTMARDFGVVLHWRILCRDGGGSSSSSSTQGSDDGTSETGNQQQRAICIMAFSNEAADELRPPSSDHVRADLKVSLSLIEPIQDNENHCRVTRIVSYDLCGNVPKALTNKVVQQQATMPLVITQHLQETEPDPPAWLTGAGELCNECVEMDVIEKLSGTDNDMNGVRRQLKFTDRGESLLLEDGRSNTTTDDGMDELPLELTAVLLLTPLILWTVANSLRLPGKEAYFVLASLLAVRAVVLSNLGRCYDGNDVQTCVGSITCRFSVDLKGVLRFIANRKEERGEEEQEAESSEVSVIHIVIGAIAAAISEAEPLKCMRVYQPLLGIDGYYYSRKGGVDISLLVPSSEDGKQDNVYNLDGIGSMSVQSIADRIIKEQELTNRTRPTRTMFSEVVMRLLDSLVALFGTPQDRRVLGSCLVIASPDHSDHSEVDIDAAPLIGSGVNVVVVVGGVRLVRGTAAVTVAPSPRLRSSSSSSIKPPPKPTLSMSITIDCPICSVAASRRFAERVQELVQFPEMCED